MKTIPFLLASVFATVCVASAKTPAESDYVAHEWGTFTSVQGQDGIQLEWNPFTVSELPKFVYNIANPQGRPQRLVLPSFTIAGKSGFLFSVFSMASM